MSSKDYIVTIQATYSFIVPAADADQACELARQEPLTIGDEVEREIIEVERD